MHIAELEETVAKTKIAEKNINNLRYASGTTLMAVSQEELKSFLIKVKEESEKAGLKLNIQKTEIMTSGPITSWQMYGETMETVTDFFLGCQNHHRWWLQPCNLKTVVPWENIYHKHRKHIKKQRQYFANKDPYHQSYGFSSSHVRM